MSDGELAIWPLESDGRTRWIWRRRRARLADARWLEMDTRHAWEVDAVEDLGRITTSSRGPWTTSTNGQSCDRAGRE